MIPNQQPLKTVKMKIKKHLKKLRLTGIIFNKSFKSKARQIQTLIRRYCFATGTDLKKHLYFKLTKKRPIEDIFQKKSIGHLSLLPNDYKYVILASETGPLRLSKGCFEIYSKTPFIEFCF